MRPARIDRNSKELEEGGLATLLRTIDNVFAHSKTQLDGLRMALPSLPWRQQLSVAGVRQRASDHANIRPALSTEYTRFTHLLPIPDLLFDVFRQGLSRHAPTEAAA